MSNEQTKGDAVESYVEMVERETAELDAQTPPPPMSDAARQAEIASIRHDPRFNSPDGMICGPLVDRLLALTSGEPVMDGNMLGDESEGRLQPDEGQEPVKSEAELKREWGSSFEANVEVLQDWTAAADPRLGGNGRVFSDALEATGLANNVGFAKAVLDVLKGGDGDMKLTPASAKALIEQLSNPKAVSHKNAIIREALADGLRLLHELAYGDEVAAGEPLPKQQPTSMPSQRISQASPSHPASIGCASIAANKRPAHAGHTLGTLRILPSPSHPASTSLALVDLPLNRNSCHLPASRNDLHAPDLSRPARVRVCRRS